MGYIDATNVGNLLNKIIMPTIQNQLYSKSILWQLFGGAEADDATGFISEKRVFTAGQLTFENNLFYVTIENGRMSTSGVETGGGKVTYGQLATDQGTVAPITSSASFIMPKHVLNYKDAGAIVKPLTQSMSSALNSLAMDLNRQCYGDGSATLAYVAASGTSTTVTLKPRATAASRYNGDIPLQRYFSVGDKVKVGANAITTVSSVGKNSIVVAASQTLVADTAVVKYTYNGAVDPEIIGLQAMVAATDGTTYMGIDSANDPAWASYVDVNSSTARTMHNSITALNKAFGTASVTGKPDTILMNLSEFLAYGQEYTGIVRFAYSEKIGGGWAGLTYMGGNASIVCDNDCPDDAVFLLTSKHLKRAQLQPLQWENGNFMGGARIPQQIDYEYIVDGMWNIFTDLRSGHAVLRELVG